MIRFATIVAVAVVCFFSISPALADVGRRHLTPPSIENERALKPAHGAPDEVASAVPGARTAISYSNTLTALPVFNRTLASCAALSGVGTSVAYQAQPFFVDTSGVYTIEVTTSTFSDGDSMLFIYQDHFDPSDAVSNCLIGDDDNGVGSLSLITTSLTAGTQYIAVTTTFDNGIVGDFTNEISGSGEIILGSPSLAITKTTPSGVPSAGPFTYRIAVQNIAASTQNNVLITDSLPGALTYISNDCGGNFASGTFTANIASIAPGASAVCNLSVRLTAGVCSAVVNTASAQLTGVSPVSASVSNQYERVLDGSFEAAAGSPINSPSWTEASSNFSSPLCSETLCGTGSGTSGPHTGNVWAWFGGISSTEISSLQQTLTIPTSSTALTFYYRLGVCAAGAGAADFLRVTIDGAELWRRDAGATECGAASYAQASVPLTVAQADGASHTLRFESTTGSTGTGSNFSVDDISILEVMCGTPTLADLSIALSNDAAPDIQINQPFHYAASVANTGPASASGVSATFALPRTLVYASNTCGATLAGNLLTWNIGSLISGAHRSCTITATVTGYGEIQTVADVVSASIGDPELANNTAVSGFVLLQMVPALDRSASLLLLGLLLGVGVFALPATYPKE